MDKSFKDNFIENFDEFKLPASLSDRFLVLECLAVNEFGETYLLSEKDGGGRFVLKCCRKTETANAIHETELLRNLEHKGLPLYETEVESEDTVFTLREYIEGIPMEQYLDEYKPDTTRVVNIVMSLCDTLTFLHSQPAPIIHRDIKPSNIIINPHDNAVTLIDFGISRKYSEDADTDTSFIGTQKFAPPEQYGFSQTDCRADIYALGVALRFMLTGSVDGNVTHKGLARIIGKCAAFSPNDRYQSADAVKRALSKYKNRTMEKSAMVSVFAALMCLTLFAGFFIGRYTDFLAVHTLEPPTAADEAYVFIEPLIEKAVRIILDKADGEPVLRSELDDITELYFVGMEVARSPHETGILRDAGFQPNGTIDVLDDLRAMKNLRVLYLIGQLLTDVSTLADCPLLEDIKFSHSPVADVSSLTALSRLTHLDLYETDVRSFSCFADMETLYYLNLAYTPLTDIAELEIANVDELDLRNRKITELNSIERFTTVRTLHLMGMSIRDFSPLDSMPFLRTILISPEMEQYLNTLKRNDLEIIVIS